VITVILRTVNFSRPTAFDHSVKSVDFSTFTLFKTVLIRKFIVLLIVFEPNMVLIFVFYTHLCMFTASECGVAIHSVMSVAAHNSLNSQKP